MLVLAKSLFGTSNIFTNVFDGARSTIEVGSVMSLQKSNRKVTVKEAQSERGIGSMLAQSVPSSRRHRILVDTSHMVGIGVGLNVTVGLGMITRRNV